MKGRNGVSLAEREVTSNHHSPLCCTLVLAMFNLEEAVAEVVELLVLYTGLEPKDVPVADGGMETIAKVESVVRLDLFRSDPTDPSD